jgi:hypothetical protein
MPLWNISDIVTATLGLYNLYVIQKDDFNIKWAVNAEKEFQEEANRFLENYRILTCLRPWSIFKENKKITKDTPEVEETLFTKIKEEEKIKCRNDEGEKTKIECQKT